MLAVLFDRLLPCPYRLTSDRSEFLRHDGPRLHYGDGRLSPDEVFLPAGPLLAETGVRPLAPEVFDCEGLPAFFRRPAPAADWPFDLPALLFFQLSRYEEYLPFTADAHGRFPASQSLAARAGFLSRPLADEWARRLGRRLEERHPRWQAPPPSCRFLPTYDVDMAWAYRHRGPRRQVAGALRALAEGRLGDLADRLAVLTRRREDPFFTFDYLDALHERYELKPRYFVLLADPGRYDPNPAPATPALQTLVRTLSRRYPVGIHPSYHSTESPGLLDREIARLNRLAGAPVSASRQHFLRLRLPATYRQLLAAGIRDDFSMGFADAPGFRAGTAHPFPWYDLLSETATPLIIHPFQVMDVTLRRYLALSPARALPLVQNLIDATRRTGGTFSTLWHNSSLSSTDGWTGWRELYEEIVRRAVAR